MRKQKKPDNPAKLFLRRYIALSGRVDALQAAINQAMERAFNTGVSIKEIKVLSSPAEHDPMARDVCNAVDACEIMYQYKNDAAVACMEILAAIETVPDEVQKELLTMRYITGLSFQEIQEKMNYERSQVFVIHGKALLAINKWLSKKEKEGGQE